MRARFLFTSLELRLGFVVHLPLNRSSLVPLGRDGILDLGRELVEGFLIILLDLGLH